MTSRNVKPRQWFTLERSRIMVGVLILLSFICRFPDLLLADIVVLNVKSSCAFPSSAVILSILVVLAVRTRVKIRLSIAQHTANRIEHQITSTVLFQAISATCLSPYTINFFYATIIKYMVKSKFTILLDYEQATIKSVSKYFPSAIQKGTDEQTMTSLQIPYLWFRLSVPSGPKYLEKCAIYGFAREIHLGRRISNQHQQIGGACICTRQ